MPNLIPKSQSDKICNKNLNSADTGKLIININ